MGIMSYLDPGDLLGTQAAGQAADIQAAAAERNLAIQTKIFDRLWDDQAETRTTRDAALGGLEQLNAGGKVAFGPGYEKNKENFLDSNQRGYAARGKLLSGERLLSDASGVSQMASNETNKGTNRLLNMAGFSTQDLNQQNQLLGSNVNQQGQNMLDYGTAKASGIMGTQNAWNDLMGAGAQIGGYYYGNNRRPG